MLNLLLHPMEEWVHPPACPLAQLHQFSLGKTARSHVFHQHSEQAWPLDSQSFFK